jgi:hypothetical protein
MKYSVLKKYAFLVSILLLIQSCSFYRSTAYTPEEAIQKHRKVKIYYHEGSRYKFKRLYTQNDSLFGIAKINSKAARHLAKQIVKTSEKSKRYVVIALNPEKIKKVKVKLETLSTITTVLTVGYVSVAALFLLIYANGGY